MDPATMRQAYVRLGFTQAAALAITDVQGVDSIEELRMLKDAEIANLCKVMRRPGGTIPNPNAAVAGQPATLPNPGIPISLTAENRLVLAAYWLRHRVRISRDVQPAEITRANIRTVIELRDSEAEYVASTDYPTINDKDWPKTIEAISEFLRRQLGETKIPLAYVIRDTVTLPPDPDPSANYATVQDEMIRRAPHVGPIFATDNSKVWDIMAAICREHACWTYVKPAQRTRDGRRAYQLLFDHYLGPNNTDNLATAAERKLETTTYTREGKRWNFEKYVRLHVEQHSILEGLVEQGYSGIDDRSKVRFLLAGIKTDRLNAVKTQIMANPALRTNFAGCVTLFQDFISQVQLSNQEAATFNVSAVGTSSTGGKVQDRYYKKEEYKKLTKAERRDLWEIRKKRKGADDSSHGSKGASAKRLKKLTQSIAAVSARLEALDGQPATEMPDNNSHEAQTELTSNRTNTALTRQPAIANRR